MIGGGGIKTDLYCYRDVIGVGERVVKDRTKIVDRHGVRDAPLEGALQPV